MSRLINGQQFPSLSLPAVGGGTISLPDDLAGSYGIVLVYRGSWCPYCNAQLASFSRASAALTDAGAKVVAFSVDDEATAAALVADADQVSALTGAYLNDDPRYLQSTGFILAPDSSVLTAVYSSAAIGRLVADDVLGFIRYTREHVA